MSAESSHQIYILVVFGMAADHSTSDCEHLTSMTCGEVFAYLVSQGIPEEFCQIFQGTL